MTRVNIPDRDYVREFGYEGAQGRYLYSLKMKAKGDFKVRLLRCLAEGLTTNEIASILGLAVSSTETYRIRLMRELNARNSCQMLKVAYDRGWLTPGEHYE